MSNPYASNRLQLEMIATHLTTAYTGATKSIIRTWANISIPPKGVEIILEHDPDGSLRIEMFIPRGMLRRLLPGDTPALEVANWIIRTINALTEGEPK